MSAPDYHIRVHAHPDDLDAQAWDELLACQDGPNPMMRHAMLQALHASGSATAERGWAPCFLSVWHGRRLEAACPLYLKGHSYGEYVFDWAWADAYERHGLRYYPKLLCAVPFTPVPGPRLLARDATARHALLAGMQAYARQSGLSSAHILFMNDTDRTAAHEAGWMLRSTVQFHWHNRRPLPYADFDEFLAGMRHDKRKKIAQERRRVAQAGVRFEVREGLAIDGADWDFFHQCYRNTYQAHYSTPYLERDFFARMQARMPEAWAMFIAHQGGRRIAASLLGVDREQGVAYGRYWGCIEHVPCLHFEACYYQPLAWCIARGFSRFEGGAQGAHKMARGLMPVRTWSAHWLSHPSFADAVARFLEQEGEHVGTYVDELREHHPFRQEAG